LPFKCNLQRYIVGGPGGAPVFYGGENQNAVDVVVGRRSVPVVGAVQVESS
jgi:hypothetical protein